MADREEILRPLRPALVPVPKSGQLGICPVCLSSRNDDFATCYPCDQAAYLDPPAILPVTMSLAGGAVHHHLRMNKTRRTRRRESDWPFGSLRCCLCSWRSIRAASVPGRS